MAQPPPDGYSDDVHQDLLPTEPPVSPVADQAASEPFTSGVVRGFDATAQTEICARDLKPGAKFPDAAFGPYQIIRCVGKGGMGEVYQASDLDHERDVAIKRVKPSRNGRDLSDRFETETLLLAGMRPHENVIVLYNSGEYVEATTGLRCPFAVMEYIPGAVSITEFVKQRKCDHRQILLLMRDVCRGVGHGHASGIVHRDLKPGNVLVDTHGKAKVIDWGLAVSPARGSPSVRSSLAQERGHIVGTLDYMAPEQCGKSFDPESLTPACDVYTLGVILYEMLVGKLPYRVAPSKLGGQSADYDLVRDAITHQPPVPPGNRGVFLPPYVARVLATALVKDPHKRFANANAMAEAIDWTLSKSPQYRVATAVAAALVAATLAFFIAVPFAASGWLGITKAFNNAAVLAVPGRDEPWADVVAIKADMTQLTDELIRSLRTQSGSDSGMKPASDDSRASLRPLLANCISRLADANAKVIVLDWILNFPATEAGADDVLANAAERANAASVPVIWGNAAGPATIKHLISVAQAAENSSKHRLEARATIKSLLKFKGSEVGLTLEVDRIARASGLTLHEAFLGVARGRTGHMLVGEPVEDSWVIALIELPATGDAFPSLALMAYSASLSPSHQAMTTRDEDGIRLRFEHWPDRQSPIPPPPNRLLPIGSVVNANERALVGEEELTPEGFRYHEIRLHRVPTMKAADASSLSLQEVYTLSDEALRARVGGKFVIFGDGASPDEISQAASSFRRLGSGQKAALPEKDILRNLDGEPIYGWAIHAATIQTLVDQNPVRVRNDLFEFGAALSFGAFGIGLSWMVLRKWLIVAVVAALSIAVWFACVYLFVYARTWVHPLSPIAAICGSVIFFRAVSWLIYPRQFRVI